MPELVTLEEDGPLGKAGDVVWVDDPKDVEQKKASAPRKSTSKK